MFQIDEGGQRFFEGQLIVDAKESLTLKLKARDVPGSVARDPHGCIVYKCAVRQRNILDARIGARVCYIRFTNSPDVWVRYVLGNRQALQIKEFDRAEKSVHAIASWVEGREVTLNRPSPQTKLGAKRRWGTGKGGGRKPGQMVQSSLRNVMVLPRIGTIDIIEVDEDK